MKFEEALENLSLKFSSSNDIPIERATILRKEWDAIKNEIDKLIHTAYLYEDLKNHIHETCGKE
jgi:hypothetical protein